MLSEFKQFALRGNVLDLAVGVVIGAAFNKIVTSFVNDLLMPPLGLLVGKMDFSNLHISLGQGGPVIAYGAFLSNVVDFTIVAFAVFLLVRQVNRWKPKSEEPKAKTKECPYCTSAIPLKATRCPQCTSDLAS